MSAKASDAADETDDQQRQYAEKNFRADVDDIKWVLENEDLTKTARAKLENLLARGLRTGREPGSPEDEYATNAYKDYKD